MIRRMRLRFAALAGERRVGLAEMMDASSTWLDRLARNERGLDAQVAESITGCPREYLRWEAEHARCLRVIAWQTRRQTQLRTALYFGMEAVHRAALFDAMRSHRVRGRARRELVIRFHGYRGFSQSMVAEHANYRRAAATLLCIRHICNALFEEPPATETLDHYAVTYNDYFATYCEVVTSQEPGESRDELLPELKSSVVTTRRQLLRWGEKKNTEPVRKRA